MINPAKAHTRPASSGLVCFRVAVVVEVGLARKCASPAGTTGTIMNLVESSVSYYLMATWRSFARLWFDVCFYSVSMGIIIRHRPVE